MIVGGVAGGMSAATRLRRLDEDASIVVLERSGHVSYANCGLPYFVGGVIEDEDDLLLQTPERLFERFRLDVRVGAEVVDIDAAGHAVTIRATADGATSELPYDSLILSPGAAPVRPPLPGFDRVRVLRTVEDAELLADQAQGKPRSAVVIGAGFVGLETAENLAHLGIQTTVVEAAGQVLTPLDPELAVLVAAELVAQGVAIETGVGVAEVTDEGVVLADGRAIPGDLVVAAIGVRPDVRLAEMAGLELGPQGGIAVDADGRTSVADVYAVGDAVEKADSVGGGSSLIALANIANRQGRRVADAICGRAAHPAPSQGTAIVKVFGVTAALTGWNETRLRAAGRRYRVIHSHPMSHAGYYPGAEPMSLKLLFDPDDGVILGAQAVGGSGVDKRIDVLATAMAAGLRADALADLELAYAPSVLLGEGSRQHVGLHGREPDVGRVRRGRGRRAARPRGDGVEAARRADDGRARARLHSGQRQRATRLVAREPAMRWAAVRSWSIARSASGATRRRCCCTNWGSRPGTSTGATRPGGRPMPQRRAIPNDWWRRRPAVDQAEGSGSLPGVPTSFAENLTAFTALVAAVCSVAPMTIRMMPSQKR